MINPYVKEFEYDVLGLDEAVKDLYKCKFNLILVMGMAIRIKARYENELLKPLEKLELEEGEEVEIEVKKALVEEFHGKMRIDKEIADEIIEMGIWG
jgi:predicted DNA-binding antitoxin AbrB/MazE fold protein